MTVPVGHALRAEIAKAPWAPEAWSSYADALRSGTAEFAGLREAVIMRVALNRRCAYVWSQHLDRAREAGCPLDRIVRPGPANGTPDDDVESALRIADQACAERDRSEPDPPTVRDLSAAVRTSLILTSAYYLSVCAAVRLLPVVDTAAEESPAMRPWRDLFVQEGWVPR